jgi:hypothetical protein
MFDVIDRDFPTLYAYYYMDIFHSGGINDCQHHMDITDSLAFKGSRLGL